MLAWFITNALSPYVARRVAVIKVKQYPINMQMTYKQASWGWVSKKTKWNAINITYVIHCADKIPARMAKKCLREQTYLLYLRANCCFLHDCCRQNEWMLFQADASIICVASSSYRVSMTFWILNIFMNEEELENEISFWHVAVGRSNRSCLIDVKNHILLNDLPWFQV